MAHSKIQTTVMRRVWRTYILSIVANNATAAGVVTVVSGVLFSRLVFVQAVFDNAMATEVGQLPQFMLAAVTQADIPSLVAFLTLFVSVIFCLRTIRRALRTTFWSRLVVSQ
jgi:hypothetical protein